MLNYVARRTVTMLLVLLGVTMLTYTMMFLAPGSPAEMILQQQYGREPSEEAIQTFREEHGFDDPLPVRYGRWLWAVLHGDLGEAYITDEPVSKKIVERIPETVNLAGAAMLVSLLIAVPAGIISAVHQGKFPDFLSQIAALFGLSIPNFWLAYILIMVFSLYLKVLPPYGIGGPAHLILPALTVGTAMSAILTRLLRASMLEVLDEEYVRTARSKGLPERIVVYKHAVKNALIPVLTVVGLQFGALLNGTVIAEVIFQRPGLGNLLINALSSRNYPVVMAMTLIVATIFVVTNFAVDLLYGYVDPRISLEGQKR